MGFLLWFLLQVRNSKASGYCLDQGAEDDDHAILYPCHGMSSQVRLHPHGRGEGRGAAGAGSPQAVGPGSRLLGDPQGTPGPR